MEILKKISIRLAAAIVLFFLLNFFYSRFLYEKDLRKFSPIRPAIDSAFQTADIIYMGESSNTSFNPWTDTVTFSIAQFLQAYIQDKKVGTISHESFHLGLFRQMLEIYPKNKNKWLVITLNMRAMGPSTIYSATEASNQQEALFYSNRLPLLTRIFLSLHYYDNANELEREREKIALWRTKNIQFEKGDIPTIKKWTEQNSFYCDNNRIDPALRSMSDAYIKEFGFILDDENPRIQDMKKIIAFCKKNNIKLLFQIPPENREYANALFGEKLTRYMDHNHAFLLKILKKEEVNFVDNYRLGTGADYTDQFYPTEHFNTSIRQKIAASIAEKITGKYPENIVFPKNNQPNFAIRQPMADSLLRDWNAMKK